MNRCKKDKNIAIKTRTSRPKIAVFAYIVCGVRVFGSFEDEYGYLNQLLSVYVTVAKKKTDEANVKREHQKKLMACFI